jgi:hypothetical protein
MNVIGSSSNDNGNGLQFSQDSAEIGVHIGPYRVGEQRCAAGRGEDGMDEDIGKRVRHSYAPPGLRS